MCSWGHCGGWPRCLLLLNLHSRPPSAAEHTKAQEAGGTAQAPLASGLVGPGGALDSPGHAVFLWPYALTEWQCPLCSQDVKQAEE